MNTEQATDTTGKQGYLPTRTRGARITMLDADAIAELCADRMTEKEACARLNIPYQTWQNWKQRARNAEKYDDVLTRIRANKIHGHIDNIRRAETGPRPDWRASAHMLKIIDAQRYGDSPLVEIKTQPSIFPPDLVARLLREAYGTDTAKPVQVTPPAALLPAPKPDTQDFVEVMAETERKMHPLKP